MTDVSHLLRDGVAALSKKMLRPPLDELKKKYGVNGFINLSLNENPLGPSPNVIKAIGETAMQSNRYPDPGARDFKSIISKMYDISTDHIIQGSGASDLIRLIAGAFIDKGDATLAPSPSFPAFDGSTKRMEGKVIQSPLKDHAIDLDDMINRITPETKLVIVCNPNNPTGTIVRRQEVDAFMEKITKDVIVVFDEAYAEFVDDPEFPDSIKYIRKGYNVIMLRSFSKAYGLAGARMGYAISTPEIIASIEPARNYFNTSKFAQSAASAALKDQDFLKKVQQLIWDEKAYYYRELDQMGISYLPTYSNFIAINVEKDDMIISEKLRYKGIIVNPMGHSGYKGYIRVTLGTHNENREMISALKSVLSEMG